LKVVLADSEIPKLQSLSFCGVDRSPDPTYLLVEGPESEVMDEGDKVLVVAETQPGSKPARINATTNSPVGAWRIGG
jgi:hypothetical protein